MGNQLKGILLASATSCLWGVLGIGLKVALIYFDPYTIVWFRFLTAFTCLLVYFSIARPQMLHVLKAPSWWMVLAGLLLAVNYIAYMLGVNLAGPGTAQLVIQTGAILLSIIGFVFFKESLTLIRGIGFIIVGIGFTLFYGYQIAGFGVENLAREGLYENLYHLLHYVHSLLWSDLGGFHTQSARGCYIKGILWVLFAAVSWTAYAVINKRLVQTWPPQQINLIVFGLPVLLFLPMVDFSLFVQPYPWWVWLLLIALGLNTVAAYGMLAAAFQYAEANRISVVITLNPVITFIVLQVMLSMNIRWFAITPMSPMAFIGAGLVIFGAVVAVGKTNSDPKW